MRQVPIDDFEQRYRSDPDPWRFATSEYEQRRYDITVACLPRARYGRAFEPGCAIGELSRRLAERCDQLVSWDGSPAVVTHATQRLVGHPNVELAVGVIPQDWPTGRFDLVVLSEVGYYFDVTGVGRVTARVADSLEPGGTLLAVHWLGVSEDHVLHGDEVHAALGRHAGFDHEGSLRDPGFRLDWWTRT